jgi:pimeloyl-ACP methyl ester carboxylesterase
MKKVFVDGLCTSYEVFGNDCLSKNSSEFCQSSIVNRQSKHTVFLHGWGGSTKSFSAFAKMLSDCDKTVNEKTSKDKTENKEAENDEIKDNKIAICIDFFGHGESDVPNAAFGLEEFARQVLAVLQTEGIQSANFVGHSFGGRVGMYLAANYPNVVEKLVLVDAAGLKPRFSLKKAIRIYKYKRANKKGRNTSSFGSSDYKALSVEMRSTFVKIVNTHQNKALKDVHAPTLIVWGEKDKDTPMYMAKKLKRNIKGSGLVVFKNSGHYSYLENARQFGAILRSFLNITTNNE